MKFLILFLTVGLLGTNVLAMNNNCELTIKLERVAFTDLIKQDQPNRYLYQGYGDMACNNESPATVFVAIRLNKKNVLSSDVKDLTISFKNFNIARIFNIFQTYSLITSNNASTLEFSGDEFNPKASYTTEFTSNDLSSQQEYFDFMKDINNSELIIEQDQFYPDHN